MMITMKKDRSGKIVPDTPDGNVVIDLGERIAWTSAEDDLEVTFPGQHPFENGNVFRKNQPAVVRRDQSLRGKHFACKVRLGGTTQDNVNGVDIRPDN